MGGVQRVDGETFCAYSTENVPAVVASRSIWEMSVEYSSTHIGDTLLKSLFIILILAVFSSCVSDEAARYYSSETYAPKEADEIDVFLELPNRPYEIIADFQARRATVITMQRKAAKIGADAVVVRYLGGNRSGRDEWASEDRSNTYRRMAGTAIKYVDSEND